MKLKLKIYNLDGLYFDDEVDLLNVTIASGCVTILANHIPLISTISISHMYVKKGSETIEFAIANGTLSVDEKECVIVTTSIEKADEINFERAEDAKERALKILEENLPGMDMKRAEVALKRALNRLSFK